MPKPHPLSPLPARLRMGEVKGAGKDQRENGLRSGQCGRCGACIADGTRTPIQALCSAHSCFPSIVLGSCSSGEFRLRIPFHTSSVQPSRWREFILCLNLAGMWIQSTPRHMVFVGVEVQDL